MHSHIPSTDRCSSAVVRNLSRNWLLNGQVPCAEMLTKHLLDGMVTGWPASVTFLPHNGPGTSLHQSPAWEVISWDNSRTSIEGNFYKADMFTIGSLSRLLPLPLVDTH